MPTYEPDPESQRTCEQLIQTFEMFSFIDPGDLFCLKDVTSTHSDVSATTTLVSKRYRLICPYHLMIQTWDCTFGELDEKAKALVLYHELIHIESSNNWDRGKYVLRPHDVEDFSEMLEIFGLHWVRRTDLPDILRPDAKTLSLIKHNYITGGGI